MLAELFKAISDQAAKAAGPSVLPLEVRGDSRHERLLIDGVISTFPIEPEFRHHEPGSLDDLIALAIPHAGKAVVWHNENAVTLLYDDSDRRDVAILSLAASEQFRTLVKLTPASGYEQRQFVHLLRFTLGCPKPQVDPFRSLNWRNEAAGEGVALHGKDRMGRTINAEASGTEELPDELRITIPLYTTAGERGGHHVQCGIELNARGDLPTIAIFSLPGEFEQAMYEHQASIHERLVDAFSGTASEASEPLPVYYGSPY